ncbi:hypothetical protein ES319_D05G372400v1 [Gossypium barbadense]|uniref:HMA domain-containing protein n=1 Tax=Gossypium barbadense TaxID=3634 RepID=A0A5J5RMJ6_GOSBA|nr:hypothetical protein ES319_D05G372400v1 [Gossypium barbadense]
MANISIIALLCFTICVSSSLNYSYGAAEENMQYMVVGHVYCDTCRVEFETKLSEPISGAVVKLNVGTVRTKRLPSREKK